MYTPSKTVGPVLQPSKNIFSRMIGLIWDMFKGILGLAGRFTSQRRFKVEEVILYSVHRAFYLWALILAGWMMSALIRHDPAQANRWTWLYIWIVFYTFVLLLFDIGTIKLLVCSGTFALIWLAAKYIEMTRSIFLLGPIFSHFQNLQPTMSGGVGSSISWLLFFPWLIMLIESYRTGRKSFSPNGIEERNIGVSKEITDRSGMHFICNYPDLLETILGFGAGTILAVDSTGKTIKEWNGILGLYFKWNRLDEILHQRSAVVDNSPNDPVEVEQVVRKVEENKE